MMLISRDASALALRWEISIRLPGAKEDGGTWEQDVDAYTGAASMMSLM